MELKPRIPHANTHACELLIVPYGIETRDAMLELEANGLLIVPYGIETGNKG